MKYLTILILTILFAGCASKQISINDYTIFKETIRPTFISENDYNLSIKYSYNSKEEIEKLYKEYKSSNKGMLEFLSDKQLFFYIQNPQYRDLSVRINHEQKPIIVSGNLQDIPVKLNLDKEFNFLPSKHRYSDDNFVLDLKRNHSGLDILILNRTQNTYFIEEFELIYNGYIYNKQINNNLIPLKTVKIDFPIDEVYTREKNVSYKLTLHHKITREKFIIQEKIQ